MSEVRSVSGSTSHPRISVHTASVQKTQRPKDQAVRNLASNHMSRTGTSQAPRRSFGAKLMTYVSSKISHVLKKVGIINTEQQPVTTNVIKPVTDEMKQQVINDMKKMLGGNLGPESAKIEKDLKVVLKDSRKLNAMKDFLDQCKITRQNNIQKLNNGQLNQLDKTLNDKFNAIDYEIRNDEDLILEHSAKLKSCRYIIKEILDLSTLANTQLLTDGFRVGLYPKDSKENNQLSNEDSTAARVLETKNPKNTDSEGYALRGDFAVRQKISWSNVKYQDGKENPPIVVSATRTLGIKTPDGKVVERSINLDMTILGRMTPEQNKEALEFINIVSSPQCDDINIPFNELKTITSPEQKEKLLQIAVNFSYESNLALQNALFNR